MKNKEGLMNRILLLFFCFIFSVLASAQISQRGVTLEYHGRQPKTVYKNPVELKFEGAGTTTNQGENQRGNFQLQFARAHAGDTIKGYNITIGNKKYVLFNADKINDWNLSTQAVLEVVLYQKDSLEHTQAVYTEAYVREMKAKFDRQRKEAEQRLQDDRETMRKEMQKLERAYQEELNAIRLRAVLFAYVDETTIDSLEYEWRQCVLRSDFDRAREIGRQMDLNKQARDRNKNLLTAASAYEEQIRQHRRTITLLEQHIQLCQADNNFNDEELYELKNSLADMYRAELEIGTKHFPQWPTEAIREVEVKLGKLLYKQYWLCGSLSKPEEEAKACLREAAQLNNSDALNDLLSDNDIDYSTRRQYAKRLVDNVTLHGYELPDNYDLDLTQDLYEAFPDFGIAYKDYVLYYHILDNAEVSMVHCEKMVDNPVTVTVPEKVKHDGKSYTVTKICSDAFDPDSPTKPVFSRDNSYNENHLLIDNPQGVVDVDEDDFGIPIMNTFIERVKFPNTVRYIGEEVISYRRFDDVSVNLPKSLKVIKDGALTGTALDKGIIILPEGIEEVGDAWMANYDSEDEVISLSLYLPSTVKQVNYERPWRLSSPFRSVKVSPQNQNFIVLNNVLFSADTTKCYWATALRDRDWSDSIRTWEKNPALLNVLYLPKPVKAPREERFSWEEGLSLEDWFQNGGISLALSVDSFCVHPDNADFCSVNGVLYDKSCECCLVKPYHIRNVVVPKELKAGESTLLDYTERVVLPKDLSPDIVLSLFERRLEPYMESQYIDTISFSYYGIERPTKGRWDFEALLDEVTDRYANDPVPWYVKGMFYLNDYELEKSLRALSKIPPSTDSLYDKLSTRIHAAQYLLKTYKQTVDSLAQKEEWYEISKIYDDVIKYHTRFNVNAYDPNHPNDFKALSESILKFSKVCLDAGDFFREINKEKSYYYYNWACEQCEFVLRYDKDNEQLQTMLGRIQNKINELKQDGTGYKE